MQCCLVVTNILGQPISPIFKGQAVQEEHCMSAQKSEDPIYSVAEVWNHANIGLTLLELILEMMYYVKIYIHKIFLLGATNIGVTCLTL